MKMGGIATTPGLKRVIIIDGNGQELEILLEEGTVSSRNLDDFLVKVSKGEISGATRGHKFGENTDVDVGTEDIVSQGGTVNILSSGSQLAVKSSDVNDASAGTGARTVKLYYLDANYNEQTETVTLNGTTLVNTIATDILRCNRMIVMTAGTGNENAGTITLENTAGGTVYLQIDIGVNQSLSTLYTVPAGRTLYLLTWFASVGQAAKESKVRLLATVDAEGNDIKPIFTVKRSLILTQAHAIHEFRSPLKFNEKADIKLNATASAVNTSITGGYDFLLIEN